MGKGRGAGWHHGEETKRKIQESNSKTEKDFWTQFAETPTGCKEFLGSRDSQGYGHAYYRGKTYMAHRLSWMLSNGAIPKGVQVLHSCDNPPCGNPAHLRLGTQADNMQECVSKGRFFVSAGSLNHFAKLDEGNVTTIKSLLRSGHTQSSIARQFNVCKGAISHIATGRNWRHVK